MEEEKLRALVNKARDLAAEGQHLNEATTKRVLIEPLLAILEWDVQDPAEVKEEYRYRKTAEPVDYGLFVGAEPTLLVEAKPFHDPLKTDKGWRQLSGNAVNAGFQWCARMNGRRMVLVNLLGAGDLDRKIFWDEDLVACTEGDRASFEHLVQCLELASKSSLATGRTAVAWEQRQSRSAAEAAVERLLTQPPPALVEMVRQEAGASVLAEGIVLEALAACAGQQPKPLPRRRQPARSKEASSEKAWGVRSYQGPLALDGQVVVLRRLRPFLGNTEEERVSLEQIRRTAETAVALREAGELISLPTVRQHPGGPRSQNPTQRSLAALQLAGALAFAVGQHTDCFEVAGKLTAEGMVQRVLEASQSASAGQATPRRREGGAARQAFKWLLTMAADGSFSMECRYLADDSKSFTVKGIRVSPSEDFKPARKALLQEIAGKIRPLFPGLGANLVRAKAWSGVHRVYPAKTYGR